MKSNVLILSDESQTLLLGSILAKNCMKGCIIYLNGDIGTGKTVFCKGFIRGLGYTNYVKSPTYTLIESYFVSNIKIHHCDCFRLKSEEEFINTGIQDCFDGESIVLVEWPPIQAIKILSIPDITITINYDSCREQYRKVVIKTISSIGQQIMDVVLYTVQFKHEIQT